MPTTEQFFTVVLFIMLYKAILTFKCVDKILECDQTNHKNPAYFCKEHRDKIKAPNVVVKDLISNKL